MIRPGRSIGILGGGQLGRMLALAAAPLGYRCHIFAPEAEAPAAQVADRWTRAAYDDPAALREFAASVDVVTYEFENVPSETAEIIAALCPLAPNTEALATAQDRLAEKDFAQNCGIDVAAYRAVGNLAELKTAVLEIGTPAVLKTRRLGYDGKGQFIIRDAKDQTEAFAEIGRVASILETFVPLKAEISIIAARSSNGEIAIYPLAENEHQDHILARTRVPARVSEAIEAKAQNWIKILLQNLNYVGVLALELFVTEEDELLFNEMAPRVHNSGHWSQDAAVTSQFEQHIRAICDLPMGDTSMLSRVEMINLIGDAANDLERYLAMPRAHVHLYGKSEIRARRKMGHVNILHPDKT